MRLFEQKVQSVRYFIMRKVSGAWKVVYKGNVPINKQSFTRGGVEYHVDMSRIQKDSSGNECLKYDVGYFEPLTEKMGTPVDALKATGSAEARQLLAREGWVAHVMRAVNTQNVLNTFMIMMLVGAGLMGYLGGNVLPVNTLLGHPSVGGYVTVTVANTTYTVSSGNTTITKMSLVHSTITTTVRTTSTSTLSVYTVTQLEPNIVTVNRTVTTSLPASTTTITNSTTVTSTLPAVTTTITATVTETTMRTITYNSTITTCSVTCP